MRYELRLILWVTAAALLTLLIWRGFWPPPDLPLESQFADVGSVQVDDGAAPPEPLGLGGKIWVGTLPDVDPEQRPMFKVEISPVPEIVTGSVETRPIELPLLKGIVVQAGRRSAVFSGSDGLLPYAITSVGEQFGGYTLVEIGSEQVTARSVDGDAVTFKLRGAGELP